ncbi:unnamed protein product [Caenorhabditis bovis]|uniref:Uncharacterized protein n=1 Tax=Caenorhabditis bovis TaxID=2654633 RepID=A0A8S1EGB5_9PELO|nr:unnamed protein product [Caenorhabditis bovis]
MVSNVFYIICFTCLAFVSPQRPYYPNHWYGANQGNIHSGVVPEYNPVPNTNIGTLAPHVCGFNTFTRKCMDPEGYCPGTCMNFRYTYNTLYDCRCLVIKK